MTIRKVCDPQTKEEWQKAVDAATGLRFIASCKMYGLLDGGPKINVARCDEILARGRRLGFRPSKAPVDLAIEIILGASAA